MAALPYLLPFGTFLVLTELATRRPEWAIWMYPLKTIVVGLMLLKFLRGYPEIRPAAGGTRGSSRLALIAGLGVFVIWILPGLLRWEYPLLPLMGQPVAFNPLEKLPSSLAMIWIGFRLLGSVVVVPVTEELF